jgi:bacteriocin-like protein
MEISEIKELNSFELAEIEGGLMIGLLICCFAAGVAIGLRIV